MRFIRKNNLLTFTGRVHGSVGISYRLEFDGRAFAIERHFRYLHPEQVSEGLCGADDAVVTYTLSPLKCGMFRIVEVEEFRGDVTKNTSHVVIVLP